MNGGIRPYLRPDVPVAFHMIRTPLGRLTVSEQSGKLIGVNFGELPVAGMTDLNEFEEIQFEKRETPVLEKAEAQLKEYFAGRRNTFSLPLNPMGTPFRRRAWTALQQIPYGRTISYSEQAEKLGGSQYCRAVGQANHHNPLAIIIPCHRVIGKSGKLVGFGSGIDNKQWLLDLEARNQPG